MRYFFFLMTLSLNALCDDKALQTLQQFHQHLHDKKADAALKMLSDDAQIFESGYAETKGEYAAHHLSADIEYASATQDKLLKQEQQCSESLCVITRQSETTGNFKQKPVHTINMETALLKLVDKQWIIEHIHWSSRKAH